MLMIVDKKMGAKEARTTVGHIISLRALAPSSDGARF